MDCSAERELAAWAARHHGLFRAEDALRFGLTRRQIAHRARLGRIERLGPNVHRIAGSAHTRDQRILSASWRARGTISHRTAAELLGMVETRRGRPHVTVDRHRAHVFDDVTVHRSQDLLTCDVTTVRNIPTTTAARTLVDVGLTMTGLELEKTLHRALHLGLTSIEQLESAHRRLSRRGRNGSGPIGELLAIYTPSMSAAESDLEVVILRVLREHGVPDPVRQHCVVIDGEEFRLDLAYPRHRVFLEGDGFGVHGARGAFEHDRWRQNLLVVDGWWPLRVTWRQAHQQPAECAAFVRRKLMEIERTWK